MPKIKPCPFCGSPAEVKITKQGTWRVFCQSEELCPSRASYFLKDLAIREWNRREKPRKEGKNEP
jgi:hypothetical protein